MSRKSSFLNFEVFPALPFESLEGVGAWYGEALETEPVLDFTF